MKKTETQNKTRYMLATASTRTLSRLLDFLVVFALSVGIILSLVLTDPGYNKPLEQDSIYLVTESWRYAVIGVVIFIVFVIYFLLIPIFFKQQTLMKMLFKIKFYNTSITSSFWWSLIKHESITWIHFMIINLILCVYLSFVPTEVGSYFFQGEINMIETNFKIFLVIISTMYGFVFLSVLLNVINLFARNKKRTWLDKISDLCVIKTEGQSLDVDSALNEKKKKKTINYGLPGEIKGDIMGSL